MNARDTLLLACGTSASRAALRAIFEADFNLLEADNSQQTKLFLEQNHHCIAVVILDLTVPEKIDKPLLNSLEKNNLLRETPIVIISDDQNSESRIDIFEKGATDVYSPNTDPYVLHCRIHNIVELYRHRWHLEELLKEQAEILQHSNDAIVDTLSSIIEYRSVESGQHILRIRRFTQILLEEIARSCPEYALTADSIHLISSASALHDIGKISIPDSVLNKPGALTSEEWVIMKSHSLTGCRILENLSEFVNHEYLRYAHNICHYHHERWDGSGYPEGIAGDEIPICAQVVGLADAYDALTTNRVYKAAYSFERAMNMIVNGECGSFSPKVLECFKHVSGKFEDLARSYADGFSPGSETFDVTLPPPVPQNGRSTLQAVQGKYQALLHYSNAAVIEVDLDQGLYHLVYNPDPNLILLQPESTFSEIQRIISEQIILPEEKASFQKLLYEDIPRFFQDGLHRQTFYFKIRSRVSGEPVLYSTSLLRLEPSDPTQRRMLILWKIAEPQEIPGSAAQSSPALRENPQRLMLATIRCRNDNHLTLGTDSKSLSDLSYLVGYSPAELEHMFHSHLVELALPQDRQLLRKQFDEQLSYGSEVELSYQVRHKNGRSIWLLHKGFLVTESDGSEYLESIPIDITRAKSAQATYHLTLEQYRMILAQTGHIVFDWDLSADEIHFSRTWQDIFGYSPVRENVFQRIHTDSHFHPDDIPRFLDWVDAFKSRSSPPAIELRLANKEGRYLWCRFRGTVSFASDGITSHLLGTIVNIDDEKQATVALRQQADQDALTKLLNKQAARRQAEEYLSGITQDSICALLIIDLDNFKYVNDQYGHMFGDTVLQQVAKAIKKLFRAHDIVSRIGGDEFMVLMRDIPDPALVEKRCNKLLNDLNQVFHDQLHDCPLSCSIGVSLSPTHSTSYHELFQYADQALYQSKHHGKNCYTVYDSKNPAYHTPRQLPTTASTRIDSEEQPNLTSSSMVQYGLQHLYSSDDKVGAVNDILALMGEQLNVSRVYVFENTPDNKFCSNTFEWCNTDVIPEKDNLQNISYETDIPNYEANFDEHGIFYCPDVSELPQHLRDILEPQGVKSLLHCAIRDHGTFRGYIGFDECRAKRLWTKDQIQTLTFFSKMLSVFLLKEQAQAEASRRAADLAGILDGQKSWIYVIDPDTCELRFMNARTRTAVPNAEEGMLCHKALANLDHRCPDCPAKEIRQTKNGENSVFSTHLGLSVLTEASLISWGNQDACLITCRELPRQKGTE